MKPPDACRFLENKTWFLGPAPAGGEPEGTQPLSTPFWCLKTHEPIGPDGDLVDDVCCNGERPCFKAQVEL